MSKKKRRQYPAKQRQKDMVSEIGCGQCSCCEQPLYKKGGYAGLGMCGPCTTGEAATIDELGDEW